MQASHTEGRKADFGMAVPYFVFGELVELKEVTVTCGPCIAHTKIGHVFGEQVVLVTGVTTDGQAWRAIYPPGASVCWILPDLQFSRSTVSHKC
jgi:hypothetical protein